MTSLSPYIGRRFDTAIWCCPIEGKTVLLDQQIFPPGGVRGVTGIQKLAQRFMLKFLTIRGSVWLAPDEGSGFMADLYGGYIRLPTDAWASFNLSALEIGIQLRAEESDDDPDDERFDSATLEQVVISSGQITLNIRITSLAGTSRSYLAPISTLPGGDE